MQVSPLAELPLGQLYSITSFLMKVISLMEVEGLYFANMRLFGGVPTLDARRHGYGCRLRVRHIYSQTFIVALSTTQQGIKRNFPILFF